MRVDELSVGRLVELLAADLLTYNRLTHDPTSGLVVVRRPTVLAELARRALTADDLLERRKTRATGP